MKSKAITGPTPIQPKEKRLLKKLYANEKIMINGNYNNTNKNYNNFVKNVKKPEEVEEMYKGKPYTKIQIDTFLYFSKIQREKIINIYQDKYINSNKTEYNPTGLGDFIRGSYFIMQYCKENELTCAINIMNHPISQFLEIYANQDKLMLPNINKFECLNYNPKILENSIITSTYDFTINNDFTFYLYNQQKYNSHKFVYVITYPNVFIDDAHKSYMKHILKPTNKLSVLIESELNRLSLIKKEYIVLHVRYGDDEILKNTNNNTNNNNNKNNNNSEEESCINIKTTNKLKLLNYDLCHLQPNTNNYLLISDNINLKKSISKYYPFIKMNFNEICHTGEGLNLEYNKLQNVLLDFYLISFASQVNSYSVYEHGSGFSKWCAETYSIPYICKLLK